MRLYILAVIILGASATAPAWVADQTAADPASCNLPAPLVCPPPPPAGPKTATPAQPGAPDKGRRAATGAAIGGATGAVVGAVVPGIHPVTGAVVGAVLGGVAGAVIKGRQYYRDTRGYCYYVDQYGNPIYDYNVRC